MRFFSIACLCAAPLFAGEYVVFTSGQQLIADRTERSGDMILLYRAGGVTHVPANAVASIEPDGRIAEAVAAPEPEPIALAPPAPPPVLSTDPRVISAKPPIVRGFL